MYLDELNVIFGWQVEFLVNIFSRYRKKQINGLTLSQLKAVFCFFSLYLLESSADALSKNCPLFRFAAIPLCWVCFILPPFSLAWKKRVSHSSRGGGGGRRGGGSNNKGERLPSYGISDQEKRGSLTRVLSDVRFNQ